MLAVFCLIEIVFTVSGTLQMSGVFGFDVAPLGGSMLLLMAVRVSLYWAIFRRLVRPTTELQRRVAAGESISESSLCAADRALQATPTALAAAAAIAYAISYPLVFLLYHQFVGDPDLPSFEGGVLAMLSLNGALSAVVVAILLLTWLLAGAAGELAPDRGAARDRSAAFSPLHLGSPDPGRDLLGDRARPAGHRRQSRRREPRSADRDAERGEGGGG
jgi:hypothetical protein